MVAKTSIYYDIVTEYQNKGAKQAQSSFNSLEKSALKLAKAFGVAFGAKEIVSFLGKSISLAAQEDQQFKVLGNTLKNLGLGFATDNSEKFITSMFLATGTAKSELIPAYQSLLTATGDVALSQKDLQLAMDVSKGTGKDLATVTTALSKGYLGNTTSLTKLGAGLDKTLVKTGRMDLITKQLSNTFKGSAATAANTFEGKITSIKAAGEEAMVILGKGLISSLQTLAGDTSLNSVTSYMTNLATETSYAVQGIADLISIIKSIPGVGLLSNTLAKDPLLAIPVVGSWLSYFASKAKKKAQSQADQISQPGETGYVGSTLVTIKPNGMYGSYISETQAAIAAQKKVLANKAAQAKLDAQILASQKAQTLATQQQALLKILGSPTTDFERANIMAALQHAQTQDVKDQLQYQLDYLDAQTQTGTALNKTIGQMIALKEAALAVNDQVMLVDGSIVNLSTAKNPFAGFPDYVVQAIMGLDSYQSALSKLLDDNIAKINAQIALLAAMVGMKPATGFTLNPTDWSTYQSPITNATDPYAYQYQSDPFGVANQANVTITLDPGLIAQTTQSTTANGQSLTINRTNNNFGTGF